MKWLALAFAPTLAFSAVTSANKVSRPSANAFCQLQLATSNARDTAAALGVLSAFRRHTLNEINSTYIKPTSFSSLQTNSVLTRRKIGDQIFTIDSWRSTTNGHVFGFTKEGDADIKTELTILAENILQLRSRQDFGTDDLLASGVLTKSAISATSLIMASNTISAPFAALGLLAALYFEPISQITRMNEEDDGLMSFYGLAKELPFDNSKWSYSSSVYKVPAVILQAWLSQDPDRIQSSFRQLNDREYSPITRWWRHRPIGYIIVDRLIHYNETLRQPQMAFIVRTSDKLPGIDNR